MSHEKRSDEVVLFDCPRHNSLRLTASSCSRMWLTARSLPRNSIETTAKCRGCAIGAQHSGCEVKAETPAQVFSMICTRCGNPARKLIREIHCLSCYNRELELIKGANARGTKPVKALAIEWQPPFNAVPVDLGATPIHFDRAVDHAEFMLSIERRIGGPLRIGYTYPIAGIASL